MLRGHFFDGDPSAGRENVVVFGVARQLVPDGRHPERPHADLAKVVTIAVGRVEIAVVIAVLVHVPRLTGLHRRAHVPVFDDAVHLVGHALADNDILVVDVRVLGNKPVLSELRIVGLLDLARPLFHGVREELLLPRGVVLLVLLFVRTVKGAVEQSSIQRAAVHDDSVLLIESGMRRDGNDHVGPIG